jgi:peptidyl-prolyl cis-trans isomerase A (cyclophilin A)
MNISKTIAACLAAAVAGLTLSSCGPKAVAPATKAPVLNSSAAAPTPAPAAAPAPAPAPTGDLLAPAQANATAPDVFKARFTTTKGDFEIEVHRDWAPQGADRFYNLVKIGYFDDVSFFRDIPGFMVQFGIHGRPDVNAVWHSAVIPDDPASGHSNERGAVTFATAGPGTRTTQLFVNFGNNAGLDGQGFTPFGKVVSGMDVVDGLYNGYGEGAPSGRGPDQGRLQAQGNAYLHSDFPQLDYIKTARLE